MKTIILNIALTCLFLISSCKTWYVDSPGELVIIKSKPFAFYVLEKNLKSLDSTQLDLESGDILKFPGYLQTQYMDQNLSPAQKYSYLIKINKNKYYIDDTYCSEIWGSHDGFVKAYSRLIVGTNNPEVFEAIDYMKKSDKTIMLDLQKGDTVHFYGFLQKQISVKKGVKPPDTYSYLLLTGAKDGQYYIDAKYVQEILPPAIKIDYKTTFPKGKEQEIWSKAINYVLKNTEMKVQTQTDLIFQTYNPSEKDQRGWYLNKIYSGDSFVIDASCTASGTKYNNEAQVQMLYYYLKTGNIENEHFFLE